MGAFRLAFRFPAESREFSFPNAGPQAEFQGFPRGYPKKFSGRRAPEAPIRPGRRPLTFVPVKMGENMERK